MTINKRGSLVIVYKSNTYSSKHNNKHTLPPYLLSCQGRCRHCRPGWDEAEGAEMAYEAMTAFDDIHLAEKTKSIHQKYS